MGNNNDKELQIELSEDVKLKLASDPKMADAIKDLQAIFRQAFHGCRTGQYKSFDEGIEILTGNRPIPIDEHTEGHSMHEALGLDEEGLEPDDLYFEVENVKGNNER